MKGQAIEVETSGSRFRPVQIATSLSSSTSTGPIARDSWEPISPPSLAASISTRIFFGPDEVQVNVIQTENEHFKWTKYLSDITARGRLSRVVTEAALELWRFLVERVPTINAPHAGPTEDGGLLMVWDNGKHHVELEVSTSGRYDWFYRDRETGLYRGEEGCTVGDYSAELRSVISIVWPDVGTTIVFDTRDFIWITLDR